MHSDHPVIRLKPKTNAQRLRHGFPWVYDNELVTDRRTKAIAPGSLAILQDHGQNTLGLFAVNPNSKIFARKISNELDCAVDQPWFAQKIAKALALREALYSQPYYRLIHAEADQLPGLIIDRFSDLLVIQPNAAWVDQRLPVLVAALLDILKPSSIVVNGAGRARVLEGLDDARYMALGEMPSDAIQVAMNGAVYFADVAEGQKTGIFYDQRPSHKFVQDLAQGKSVLDVFSHVGGFGLAAMANGAANVTCVDGSQPALTLASRGALATRAETPFEAIKGDAFDVMGELAGQGKTYELVICDPPAFAPQKAAREAGLRAYERVARLASALVAEGGYLTLCSCSHAADIERFRAASIRGIGRAGRQAQLIYTGGAGPDHPHHMALAESSYLKTLVFRMQ
ncbi:class I SAM-dependent rRNA methyltransferase [Planktomarina temperata]|uniref:RSP_2647 family RNA methyltransferase n=1 Tax=Planktomarina temperata TaxID=1284658 RepID=UPI001D56F1FD|nr:class I SAM-dependent rRNA methyltransferase [Planktomarina temperata]